MKTESIVLIVDDVPEYLDTIELNLPNGRRALWAISLAEARALVDSEQPSVAVVDVRLREDDPENRDGLEFLKWVQQRHPEVTVIMISAYQEFEFKAESLALGTEFFLKKPIQPKEFRETVVKVLEQNT